MKQSILIVIIFCAANFSMAQNRNRQVEIEPFLRWDTYPQFTNAINSIATYKLDIKGNSWGVNAAYKVPLKNNFLIKVGIGFYKYSFNKIESTHRSYGKGYQRVINYPTTIDRIITTDKYWYNTISLNIGIEKHFVLKKDLQIIGGIDLKKYFTFSQQYHIPSGNDSQPEPSLRILKNYKTSSNRNFGLGTEFHIGVLKKLGKVNIGPSLIIPIYNTWKQDEIFPTEINSNNRSKWFRGIGAGIICNYSLSK